MIECNTNSKKINSELLDKVVGGGNFETVQEILPGQEFCPTCYKGVFPTTNANLDRYCPECGYVFFHSGCTIC